MASKHNGMASSRQEDAEIGKEGASPRASGITARSPQRNRSSRTPTSKSIDSIQVPEPDEPTGYPVFAASAETSHEKLPITISLFQVIAAGWNICNSWAAPAATLALSISSGGTVTVIYGILVIVVVLGATGFSLAEMAARYPTAGGQYHWTAYLAPQQVKRGLSYSCGLINTFGWIVINAGSAIIPPQLVTAIVVYYHPTYVPQKWHVFLEALLNNFFILFYNLFVLPRAEWTHNLGFALSLAAFFIIAISCLAISSPKQSTSYVWGTFYNPTGWSSDGVVFLTGLVSSNYMYAGLDGAIHLAEDCANAAVAVPRAIISVIGIGFVTTFLFIIAMIYSISDFNAVAETPTGEPIFELWRQACKSGGAATTFTIVLCFIGFFAFNAGMQTSSRLTWAFARDDAIILSKWLRRVHPTLGVPIWAYVFNDVLIIAILCIYLGSTAAFYALIGSGLILQQLSYAIPIVALMIRRRDPIYLPNKGHFNWGVFGWVFNVVAVGWTLLALVVYDLPLYLPVTSDNMNYTCAVLGGLAIFGIINWFVYTRKYYHGPVLNMELIAAETRHM